MIKNVHNIWYNPKKGRRAISLRFFFFAKLWLIFKKLYVHNMNHLIKIHIIFTSGFGAGLYQTGFKVHEPDSEPVILKAWIWSKHPDPKNWIQVHNLP